MPEQYGLSLYTASVPVFLRYLERLAGLLDAAQAHVDQHGLPPAALLHARLAPDMANFEAQVMMTVNFALRACLPPAGQALPSPTSTGSELAPTFDGLRQRISAATDQIDRP